MVAVGWAIETRGLTKFYGKVLGIRDLDLEVPEGEVFGFLGPNGAGKSTTIRLLLDFLRPTRGGATVLGLDCRRESLEVRRRVRYLPAELSLWGALRGRELLEFLAALEEREVGGEVDELAERLELDLERVVGDYSTGNRRKLGLVHAFASEPELVILDEPSTGLDPLIRQEFYALVDEARAAGRTVFLSSHNLPEVERVADRVGIVRAGELVTVQTIEELEQRAVRRFEIRFAEPVGAAEIAVIESVTEHAVTDDGRAHLVSIRGEPDVLIKAIAEHTVTSLTSQDAGLEDVFLDYYREANG